MPEESVEQDHHCEHEQRSDTKSFELDVFPRPINTVPSSLALFATDENESN